MKKRRLKGYWDVVFKKEPYQDNDNDALGEAFHPDIGDFMWRSAYYDSRTDEWVIVMA